MYLMGFDGRLGSGKTYGMSLLAQHFRQRSGCTLYSNYGLTNSKLFTSFEHFLDVAEQPSSIICLDEIHVDLDSRSGNTNSAKYLSHMLFYLRKLRCTLMFASPDITNVDIRVRLLMDVYCQVKKDKTKFTYNLYDMQDNRFLKTLKINKQKAFAIGDQIYDTNKMVVPMEFPDKKEDYVGILNKLKSNSDLFYDKGAMNMEEQQVPEFIAI